MLGVDEGADPAAPLRALAGRLGRPVPPAPATGSRHAEACDILLLRATEPSATALRPAATIHNTLLRQDRAALAALYEARGEPAVPVFSNDGGIFAARWDDAALIVLTVDALDQLPAGLPARPGVYLCARGTIDDGHWPAVTELQPDVVVLVPAGRAWLLEQLDDPATSVQRPRGVQGLR